MYISIIYKILIYFNLLQNILIYLKSDLILFEKTKITNKMIAGTTCWFYPIFLK